MLTNVLIKPLLGYLLLCKDYDAFLGRSRPTEHTGA